MNLGELITRASLTTSICKMELKDNNIVFIHTFEDASIEIPEIDDLNRNLISLVNGQPCYLIVFPAIGSTSSQKARKYAAKLKEKNVEAQAIIVDSIALRLLANFYIKVNGPKQMIKLFSNESSALTWIYSIIKEKS